MENFHKINVQACLLLIVLSQISNQAPKKVEGI
jgi:hypothetical protein